MTIFAATTIVALTTASPAHATNDPAFAIYFCSDATDPDQGGSAAPPAAYRAYRHDDSGLF